MFEEKLPAQVVSCLRSVTEGGGQTDSVFYENMTCQVRASNAFVGLYLRIAGGNWPFPVKQRSTNRTTHGVKGTWKINHPFF